jgi:cell division protein FtsB
MAKALFGHVVAPAQLRVVEENAALRARVRRLEQEVAQLRAEREADREAAIAHELLSLAGDNAEPALA